MDYAAVLGFGTLGSLNRVVYEVFCRAWERARGEPCPFSFPSYMTGLRQYVKAPGDLFVATDAALRGELGEGIDVLRGRNPNTWLEGMMAYEDTERHVMADPIWPGMVTIHGGVRSMIRDLKAIGAAVYILGETDKDMLLHIMEKKRLRPDWVVGSDEVGGRIGQLGTLMGEGLEPSRAVAYDDVGDNLLTAQRLGFHAVAAPHGHDDPYRLARWRQATLDNFPGVFADVLDIEAGRRLSSHS